MDLGLGACTWDFAIHTGSPKFYILNYVLILIGFEAQNLGLVDTSGAWDLEPYEIMPC